MASLSAPSSTLVEAHLGTSLPNNAPWEITRSKDRQILEPPLILKDGHIPMS
jgi:hypothetical protein